MTDPAPVRRPRGRPRATGTLTCPRCQEPAPDLKYAFPEGRICGRCYDTATHTHGPCSRCNTIRLTPGISDTGPTCVDCAGISQDFHCTRCGTEAARLRTGICERCTIHEDLNTILHLSSAGDTPLHRLRDRLINVDRPRSIYTWMRTPATKNLLTAIGDGSIALTHDALDEAPFSTTATGHLRGLLVEVGILPPRDEALIAMTAWIPQKLASIDLRTDRDTINRFATWHHLRRVRDISSRNGNTRAAAHNAKQEITMAVELARWLHEHGRTLTTATQSDIDTWLSTGPSTRYTARGFITFATTAGLVTNLTIPKRRARTTRAISNEQRLDWIRRCLDPTMGPATHRLAAMLLLVYGQPLTRLQHLTTTAITELPDGTLTITFNIDAVPLPEPFATLCREHLTTRTGTTHTDPTPASYLFPGRNGGTHMRAGTIRTAMNRMGIDVLAGKNTALDELVTSMPAPLVADALGYSYNAMNAHAQRSTSAFSTYAEHRLNASEYNPN